MKNRFAFLICLAGLLAVHSSGNCEKLPDLAEKVNGGSINWTKGIIQATGIKIPENGDLNIPVNRQKALAAATAEAFDKLLDVVKTIKINNELKIESLDTKNKAIIEKIEHMVKNAKIVEQKYLTDGKVEVTVQMELRGGFTQLVLPEEIKQISDIKVIKSSKKNDPSIKPKSGLTNPEEKKDFFTGLIIDATGINAKPSIFGILISNRIKSGILRAHHVNASTLSVFIVVLIPNDIIVCEDISQERSSSSTIKHTAIKFKNLHLKWRYERFA